MATHLHFNDQIIEEADLTAKAFAVKPGTHSRDSIAEAIGLQELIIDDKDKRSEDGSLTEDYKFYRDKTSQAARMITSRRALHSEVSCPCSACLQNR